MSTQGYPSKCHRGPDKSRQSTSSSQPQTAMAPVQIQGPTTFPDSQGYAEAPRTFPQLSSGIYESFAESMDRQHDESQVSEPSPQKFGSSSAMSFASYVHVPTPSGELTASYGMVHSRSSGAYSSGSGSNQSSEESGDGQQAYYSPPRQSWIPAPECNIPPGELQQSDHPLSHQDHTLMHLASQELQPKYDPYQQQNITTSSDYAGYQEWENYTYQPVDSSLQTEIQPVATSPWNQFDHRVLDYDSSIAVFGVFPGPAVTPEALQQLTVNTPSRKLRPSTKTPSSCPRALAVVARNKEPSQHGEGLSPQWVHITFENGKPVRESKDVSKRLCGGRRIGKLRPDVKKKASRVRDVGACLNCWLAKVPCSEDKVCERCHKQYLKKSLKWACSRTGLKDFGSSLFPDLLNDHLTSQSIELFMRIHSKGYKDRSLNVDVTIGLELQPMRFNVHTVRPKSRYDSDLLKQHHLTTLQEEDQSRMACRWSAPVGLMNVSMPELRKTLRHYLKKWLDNSQYVTQTTAGDTSPLSKQILNYVSKFQKATGSDLLHKALTVHAIAYFMSRMPTFTDESAAEVYDACASADFSSFREGFLSSRLLTRQLKYGMNRLQRDLIELVLHDLELLLRRRTTEAWGEALATILVLGICAEDLQIAVDTFVVCDMKRQEGPANPSERDVSFAACSAVEEHMWERFTSFFHDIYRTSKAGHGGRNGGFNPFRAVDEGTELETDDHTKSLVKDIHCLLDRNVLTELCDRPVIVGRGNEAHMVPLEIKVNATGRLTAKFLMIFCV